MLVVKGMKLKRRNDTQAQSLYRPHMWAYDWCLDYEYEIGTRILLGESFGGGAPRFFSSSVVKLVYL